MTKRCTRERGERKIGCKWSERGRRLVTAAHTHTHHTHNATYTHTCTARTHERTRARTHQSHSKHIPSFLILCAGGAANMSLSVIKSGMKFSVMDQNFSNPSPSTEMSDLWNKPSKAGSQSYSTTSNISNKSIELCLLVSEEVCQHCPHPH